MASRIALFITTALLVSCHPPMEASRQGGLTLSFQTGRTVVAQFPVDHYAVTLTNADDTLSASGQTTVVFEDLAEGTWDVSAVALSSTDQVIAAGSMSVELTGGGTSVVVALSATQTGSGTFSFSFTAPGDCGIQAVEARLLSEGNLLGQVTLTGATLPLDPDSGRLTGNVTNDIIGATVPSGSYLLFLDFVGDQGQSLGHHGEAVNVWDNVVSNAWLDAEGNLHPRRDFAKGELASTSAVLGGLTVAGPGSLVTFAPSTLAYRFHAPGTFTVTAQEGQPGQNLQYSQDGAPWSDLRWDETLEVDFQTSTEVTLRVTAADRSTFLDYSLVDPYEVVKMPKDPAYVPGGLTVGADGALYVLDPNSAELHRVEPNGDSTLWASGSELSDAYDLVADQAGNLYFTSPASYSITKVTPSGNFELVVDYSSSPIGASAVSPAGIAVNAAGTQLYFTDRASARVITYDTDSGLSTVLLTNLDNPGSMVLGADQFLYVAGGTDGLVHRLSVDGATHTVLWSEAQSAPMGIALDDQGAVYVTLSGSHRVIKIRTDNGITATTIVGGTEGSADGVGTSAQLRYPEYLCRSPEGVFYFTERGEPRVRTIQ